MPEKNMKREAEQILKPVQPAVRPEHISEPGKELYDMSDQIRASGERLLTVEEIRQRVAESRGA